MSARGGPRRRGREGQREKLKDGGNGKGSVHIWRFLSFGLSGFSLALKLPASAPLPPSAAFRCDPFRERAGGCAPRCGSRFLFPVSALESHLFTQGPEATEQLDPHRKGDASISGDGVGLVSDMGYSLRSDVGRAGLEPGAAGSGGSLPPAAAPADPHGRDAGSHRRPYD